MIGGGSSDLSAGLTADWGRGWEGEKLGQT